MNGRNIELSLKLTFLAGLVWLSGCTLTATRPIQEMANAEAAIHAAKNVAADSLVPELFRKSEDYYSKAKHEYRLKNFERARKIALHATRLAERAEFEAYRLGGANPEVVSKLNSPEGASHDVDSNFEKTKNVPGEPSLPPEKKHGKNSEPPAAAEPAPESSSTESGSSSTETTPAPAPTTEPSHSNMEGMPGMSKEAPRDLERPTPPPVEKATPAPVPPAAPATPPAEDAPDGPTGPDATATEPHKFTNEELDDLDWADEHKPARPAHQPARPVEGQIQVLGADEEGNTRAMEPLETKGAKREYGEMAPLREASRNTIPEAGVQTEEKGK